MPRVVKKIKSVTIGPCTLYLGRYQDFFLEIKDKVDLVVTDPPYGCRRPSQWTNDPHPEIEGNDVIDGQWAAYPYLKETGCIYSFCTWDSLEAWKQEILRIEGLRVRSCIVWDKVVHGMADLATCWSPRHELILFTAKGRHELRSPRPQDVLRVQRIPGSNLKHPYQKPTELIVQLIQASSDRGDLVADWFFGSGTTALACIKTGRRFIGCEVDPQYFEIACERIRYVLSDKKVLGKYR